MTRLVASVFSFVIASASVAQASDLLEPVDLGVGGFFAEGLVQRLEPHWKPVDDCKSLVIDRGAELQYWFAARDVRDGVEVPIHVACAMEEAGNRVTGVVYATARHPQIDEVSRAPFFRIALAGGGVVIVNGYTAGSDRSQPGVAWLFSLNRTIVNAATGRALELTNRRIGRAGGVENPITAMLLGRGGLDLTEIGLGAPGAPVPRPGVREIHDAFLARIRERYPSAGCLGGFRSTLLASAAIEVCINYNEMEISECRRGGDGREERCTVEFLVIVGSDTHPGMNPRFAELAQPGRLVNGNFRYDDARGWRWVASDDEVDSFVPAEFRERPWRR